MHVQFAFDNLTAAPRSVTRGCSEGSELLSEKRQFLRRDGPGE